MLSVKALAGEKVLIGPHTCLLSLLPYIASALSDRTEINIEFRVSGSNVCELNAKTMSSYNLPPTPTYQPKPSNIGYPPPNPLTPTPISALPLNSLINHEKCTTFIFYVVLI